MSDPDLPSKTTSTNISISVNNIIQSSDQPTDYHRKYDNKILRLRTPDHPERQFRSSTTQPHTDSGIGHHHNEIIYIENNETLCEVCGDFASGIHYGVASCEGCKAFFKRTIQGNIEYICTANGDCEINRRRRTTCPACRFRKCLRSGMLKEGVGRGGRQYYRRNPGSPYQVQVLSIQKPHLLVEDIKILEVLISCEPDCLEINTTLGNSKDRTLSILKDLYDRELIGIILWAKQIPAFSDLSLNDQMRLLQSTWAEILTLTLVFRSLPMVNLGRLKFAVDFTLDDKQSKDCGAIELYQTCMPIVERLESLTVLKEEYYLLKALVLTNSDVKLDEYQTLKKFRVSILSALSDALTVLKPNNVVLQIQQLLLCLPALRQGDHIVKKFWSEVLHKETVSMNKLFLEMF